METFAQWSTILIVFAVIALLVQTQLPKHWQTPGGFLAIVVGGIPVALGIIVLLGNPMVMAAALFIFGILCCQRRA